MQVKGTVLSARLDYARKRGKQMYAAFVDALSEPTRRLIEDGILPTDWYAFDVFCEMTEVLDLVAGKGDLSLCEDMGRFACDANITRFYRVFMRFGNVEYLMRRAASAWRVHYDAGNLQLEHSDRNKLTLSIVGLPQPRHSHCLAVLGFVKRAGELTGCQDVAGRVVECRQRGGGACRLTGTWK